MFGRNPDGTVYYKQDVTVDRRENYYERNKARILRYYRNIYGDHIFFGPEFYIRTFIPNVDDYKMERVWNFSGRFELGHLNDEYGRANLYEDRLY